MGPTPPRPPLAALRRLSVAPPSPALHPSLHALLAWRHCQLLSALPNRGGEADAWGDAAHKLWAQAHSNRGGGGNGGGGGDPRSISDLPALDAVLGARAALTGQGSHGGGWVASLLARRLLFA